VTEGPGYGFGYGHGYGTPGSGYLTGSGDGRPGIIPLRPLSAGEILDGSFTAMKRYPRAILGPSAIVAAVSGVLTAAAGYLTQRYLYDRVTITAAGGSAGASDLIALLVLYGGTVIVSVLADAILTGVLTTAVGSAVLGRKETAASAWAVTRPRLGAIIAAVIGPALLVALGWAAAAGVSAAIGFAIGAGAHLAALGVLTGVLCALTATVLAVMTGIRWSLVLPVVVLERAGPFAAMRRSWQLVRRSSWRVFGILCLAWLIAGLAGLIIRIPFSVAGGAGALGSAAGHPSGPSVTAAATGAIGAIIASTVTAPLLAGVVVLLYADLRMRREGMDIALRAAAPQAPPPQAPPGTVPAAPPQAPPPAPW
jgi:hypothetical protein